MENTPSKNTEILELYKLHAELAERVIQRRESAIRQYTAIWSSLLMLAGIIIRFSDPSLIYALILFVLGIAGCAVAAIWYDSADTYTHSYNNKLKVLIKMEDSLLFPFIKEEKNCQVFDNKLDRPNFVEIQLALPLIFMCIFICVPIGAVAYYVHQRFQTNILILIAIGTFIAVSCIFMVFRFFDPGDNNALK